MPVEANQKNDRNSSCELWPIGILITGFFESHFRGFHFRLLWPWEPRNGNSYNNEAKATAEVFKSQCTTGLPENVCKCPLSEKSILGIHWIFTGVHDKKRLGTPKLDGDVPFNLLPYSVKHIIRTCSTYLTKETSGLCPSKLLRPGLWLNKSHACLGEKNGKYWKVGQKEFSSSATFWLLQSAGEKRSLLTFWLKQIHTQVSLFESSPCYSSRFWTISQTLEISR